MNDGIKGLPADGSGKLFACCFEVSEYPSHRPGCRSRSEASRAFPTSASEEPGGHPNEFKGPEHNWRRETNTMHRRNPAMRFLLLFAWLWVQGSGHTFRE